MNFTSKSLQSIFIILVSIQIAYSQDSSFVVGVWTTMGPDKSWNYPDPPDSAQVKALGVDLVLHTAIPEYSNYLNNFDKVIAVNAYEETDYIHTYSGSYYSRWVCEEDQTITNIPGIKHDAGTRFGSAWSCDTTNAEIGDLVITGPDYDQDKRYRFYFNSDPIDYKVKFRVKIGQSTQDHDSVCVISVRYVTSDSRDTVLAYKTIYSDSLSTSYQVFALGYSIPDTIDSKSTPLPSVSPEAIGLTSEMGVEKSANAYGVQFNVMYLGKHALYFDYIEVYDNLYGVQFVNSPTTVKNIVENYASTYSRSNLEYWYSLDEPKTIDNYEPYRIVDSILQNATEKPLITSYYPEWDGKRNNEPSMKKFVDKAEPSRLMFYYYPYSPGVKNVDGLRFQQLASDYNFRENDYKDYYFLAQAHGFWKDKDTWEKRRPISSELNASCMLALSYGAKGLLFWHYLTFKNEDGSIRNFGLVDSNNQVTDLWCHIKNKIVPRLHGTLGNTLMDLKYKGDYEYVRKNFNGVGNASIDSTNLIISTFSSDSVHIHIGELVDETVSDTKYYMFANLICGDSTLVDSVNLGLDFSQLPYNNYLFASVEGEDSLRCSFHSGSSQKFKFHAGQGVLFKLGPILKYGGNLVYDDTVSTNITLSDNMTIKQNADLSIEAVYTVDSDIYVENGGKIDVKWYYGNIDITTNGSIGFEDWSDCLIAAKTSNLQHPKLIYSANSSPYLSHYKIYKKYGSSAWAFIDTTSLTTYTDLNTTIVQPGGQGGVDVKYKVAAVIVFKQTTEVFTNEVIYPTSGQEIEKRGNGENAGVIPTTFGITQNYPNPFNPTTEITYQVPEPTYVTIKVYDILGDEITVLVSGVKNAGIYTVRFDTTTVSRRISSGTYIYRMKAGKYTASKKMIVLK